MVCARSRRLRKCGWMLVLALTVGLVLTWCTSRVAQADGGAPNLAYIVTEAANGGNLVIIDLGTGQLAAHLEVGGDSRAVILSVDSRFAYVSQSANDAIAIVDAHTRRMAGTLPTGDAPGAMALDIAVTGYLYVVNTAGDSVTALDLAQRRTVATIPVGKSPRGIAVAGPGSGIANPGDAEIYVANAESNSVSVISARSQQVVADIPVPGGPQEVVVPATGGVAYVGTSEGTILALDLASHQPLGQLLRLKGGAPGVMDYDAVTGEIYVPDPTGGVVEVLRPASPASEGGSPTLPDEPARTLPIADGPTAVAITFDGALGFVAQRSAGRVAMFDAGTYTILTTFTVGDAPRAIITGAYPPRAPDAPATTPSLDGGRIALWIAVVVLVVGGTAYFGWSVMSRRSRLSRSRKPASL
jgi:YVTN family beta-propeller protein